MAHLDFENEIRLATEFDNPITKIPLARWQRKEFESSRSSVNNSINASLQLNVNVNDSVVNLTNVHFNNSLKCTNYLNNKTPTKAATPKTPGRKDSNYKSKINEGKKTPCNGPDRFIPNRNAMNFDLNHYLITQNDKSVQDNEGDNAPDNRLSEMLNGDLSNYRILCYQDKAPIPIEGQANGLKAIYSSSKYSSVKKPARHIPSQPERILDAPDVMNDYYLQLLDWNDSNILAVALGRDIYLWNAINGEIENLFTLPEGEYVSSVSWVEGANSIAVGTSQADIHLWDADDKRRLRTLRGHSSRVSSLNWNSHFLSSGSRNGAIFHHDVRIPNHHIGTLNGHQQEVCGLKWSQGGQYLASGGNDNLVNVWSNNISQNANDNKPIYTFTEHQSAVKAIAWCPWKTNLLATGGGTADRKIRIWNINNGSNLYTIDAQSQVSSLLWSKHYRELISAHGYANNELSIWKYPCLTKIAELTGHTSRILGMAMSPDGSTVVSMGADETLRFWECFKMDVETKKKSQVKVSKDLQNQVRLNGIR